MDGTQDNHDHQANENHRPGDKPICSFDKCGYVPGYEINRMNSAIDSNAFWHTTVSTRLTLEGFIFTSPPQKNVETRPSGIRIPTGLKIENSPVNPTKAG